MRTTDRRSMFALAAALGAGAALPAAARPLDQVLSSRRLRAGINPTLPPLAPSTTATRSTASTPTLRAKSRGG